MRASAVLNLVAPLLLSCSAAAQDRESLERYVQAVSTAFVDSPKDFIALYGSTPATDRMVQASLPRQSGSPRTIRWNAAQKAATVLLSGHAELDDSGNETSASLRYSGLHVVRWMGSAWKVESRVPFSANRIRAHKLDVRLDPSVGISATDDMDVVVGTDQGFFFGLNTGAVIEAVKVDGHPTSFLFQDGFVWIDARPGARRVSIKYRIRVERIQGGNSAMFSDAYGHVRNQYWWHPFLGFGVDQGLADFDLSIEVPERLRVAVDLPQTESVADGKRTLTARSPLPIAAVSWAYDEAWSPVAVSVGDVAMTIFATPDYTPKADQLVAAGEETWALLSARFGKPQLGHLSIVQARGRVGTGWHFFSNQAIFTGATGGVPSRTTGFPVRAFFDHEVGHLWTRPSGATRNFLAEGWATYVESLVVEHRYGAEAARWFWSDQARLFLVDDAAMAGKLNDDPANSGVSYSKGAWTLAMLERALGRRAFDAGMRAYVSAPLEQTDYESFIRGFGSSAGHARRFLTPWVEGQGAPRFTIERQGSQLVLIQNGAYWLPRFSYVLERQDRSMDWRAIDIDGTRTTIPDADHVVRIRLDPAGEYLLAGDRVVEVDQIASVAN